MIGYGKTKNSFCDKIKDAIREKEGQIVNSLKIKSYLEALKQL